MSVLGLLRNLDPSRYRPLVITEVPNGRIAKAFSDFNVVPDPCGAGSGAAPGQPFSVAKFVGTLAGLPPRALFLRKHDVAVVHSNDGRTHAKWALAARLAGVPLLWHHRGDPNALGLRLAAPLLASRVLTVSAFAKPPAGWWSAANKCAVVHSPFDTKVAVDRMRARSMLVKELGVAPNTLILGYFGSLVTRKRPLLFVDTLVELQKRLDRPVVGVVFGDRAKNPSLADALDRRIQECDAAAVVRVLGHRDNGPFWIAACDQLIVPAVNEPFGRTLVEAMLVGTPVVAASSGGNVEALEGGRGLLVPPDDAQALASAAAHLATQPEEAALMAAFAQSDARRRFGEEAHVAQVSAAYEELARDREARPYASA